MGKDLQSLCRFTKKVKSYYFLLLALCFLVALSGWLILYLLHMAHGGNWYENNNTIVWIEIGLSALLLLFSTTMLSWFIHSKNHKRGSK